MKVLVALVLGVFLLATVFAAGCTTRTTQNKTATPIPSGDIKGFSINIEGATLDNANFRQILYTSKYSQLALMSLKPGEDIGMEVHKDNDQFFRIEKGQGKCVINGNEYELSNGVAVVVPAGAQHNIINTSQTEDLKLYTIYSPPHHKDGIVRATKEEADANPTPFDGVTTE